MLPSGTKTRLFLLLVIKVKDSYLLLLNHMSIVDCISLGSPWGKGTNIITRMFLWRLWRIVIFLWPAVFCFFPQIHKMDYIKNKISDLGLEQWASSYEHLLLLQRTVAHSWNPYGASQPLYLQIQRRQPPLVASKLQQAHTRYINIVTKFSLATLRHEIHYW